VFRIINDIAPSRLAQNHVSPLPLPCLAVLDPHQLSVRPALLVLQLGKEHGKSRVPYAVPQMSFLGAIGRFHKICGTRRNDI
jgi:hypothetical protein